VRHAPAPKAAGDPLVVVVLVVEAEEVADLEEEEVVAAVVDDADIRPRLPSRMRPR